MYCKKCGTENEGQAKFCKSCGASLKQSNGTAGKKKRKKGVLLVLFAVIILVVVAGYVALQYLKKEKEIQNNIQTGQEYLDGKEYEEAEEFYEEQEKKQIAVDELEEGYYSKEDPKENVSVSLIKDYQGVMCATVDYYQQDGSGEVYFEWKEDEFCQITSTEDDAYEVFLEQDGTDLVLSLKKEGENILQEVTLQKQKYLNHTNVILGLKNYLEEKEFTMLSDTEMYALPTNEMERDLYNEMIEIPIKIAGEEETVYCALVATKAFEESGYVGIYSEEDMKEITAEDSFVGKEPLEEFSIYEYYEFE